jgi:beta-hydroxyacyl-ACP dehydratase FabZ
MVLGPLEIREVLPHRYPFLLVDRIVEMGDMSITGIKNVTVNEPFFEGHFPQKPVMPGVLIIECMAQVAGVLIGKKVHDSYKKLMFLASIESAKFRRTVEPGDQLRIEVLITRFRPSAAKVDGKATVDGAVVAEAELMCAIVDRPGAAGSGGDRPGAVGSGGDRPGSENAGTPDRGN